MRHQVPIKYGYSLLRGFLEPELDLLELMVKPGDRVVDIGANRGIYAYKLWRLGAKIEMFEPNPVCCAVLSAWARTLSGVTLHQIALSDRMGSATLRIPIDTSGVEHDASASIELLQYKTTSDQQVDVATLDSFDFHNVVLVKIDVEGHEWNVIEGAARMLGRTKPALLVEIEQRHNRRPVKETFNKLRAYGYRAYFLQDGALQGIDEFDQSLQQVSAAGSQNRSRYINNFLFLSENRIAAGNYGLPFKVGSEIEDYGSNTAL